MKIDPNQKRPIWVTCKWNKEQLHNKSVDYDIKTSEYQVVGVGVFDVDTDKNGKMTIDILGEQKKDDKGSVRKRVWIYQPMTDSITKLPEGSATEFSLKWSESREA